MKKRKKMFEKNKRGKTAIALTQILILMIATIAFAWMIGGSIKVVSAAGSAVGSPCQTSAGATGTCIDTTTQTCSGNLVTGLCSGGNNVVCCIPPATTSTCPNICGNGDVYAGKRNPTTGTCVIDSTKLVKTCGGNGCTGGICDSDSGGGSGALSKVVNGIGTTATTLGGLGTIGGVINKGIKILSGKSTTAAVANNIVYLNAAGEEVTTAGASTVTGGATNAAGGTVAKQSTNKFTTFIKGPWGNVFASVAWAVGAYTVITILAHAFASQRNAGDISTASLIGAGAGILSIIIGTLAAEGASGPPGWIAAIVTAVFAGIYMLVGFQKYSREIFTYRIGLWQPTTVGSDCNKCNLLKIGTGDNQVSGCSKYICHSYGTACEWINNETKYETCIETNIGDISPPVITPAKEIYGENVFPNTNYNYATSSGNTKIVYGGEGSGAGQCVPAFSPIKLAFKTNENANCRINIAPTVGATNAEKFSNMKDMAEGTVFTQNHTLNLPSLITASNASLESQGYELTNGGIYKFYIRCKDVRGNINTADYQMSFCVQIGPDTSPPEITGTNPLKDSFIKYGTDKIENFQVYTNEPADCKWDTQSKAYAQMNYNFSRCSQNIDDALVGFDFGCEGNLTGFKNGVENKYYIACVDQPELKGTAKENKRNVGRAQEIIFKGTNRLMIQGVKINDKTNGTVLRSAAENMDVAIEVATVGGAEDGKARCMYSEDKALPRTYSLFENGNNREFLTPNIQTLYMPNGTYKFYIQCFDVADNYNETMINFSVQIDKSAPIVVRVYKDENANTLTLITDEVAECVYSNSVSTYEYSEGTVMESADGKQHSVEWNPELDFYIKCKDEFGNMPGPGEVSIIARPFEIYQTA